LEALFLILIGGAVAGAALYFGRREQVLASWRQAADELLLELRPGGVFKTGSLHGTLEGCRVRVDTVPRGSESNVTPFTRIWVGADEIPDELVICGRAASGRHFKVMPGVEQRTGEARFDTEILVCGHAPTVAALFDQRTRNLTLYAVPTLDVVVRGRELHVELEGIVDDAQRLTSMLQNLSAMGAALSAGEGILERLIANCQSEKNEIVRLRCIERLSQHFAEEPDARAALEALCTDGNPRVRLAAARLRGDDGLEVLESLAVATGIPADVREAALNLLAPVTAPAVLGPMLEKALTARSARLVRAAAALVAQIRWMPAVPRLLPLLERPDVEVVGEARRVLSALYGPDVERILLGVVQEGPELRRKQVLEILGRDGSREVIEPLVKLTQLGNLRADTQQLVRRKVAEIIARTGDPQRA
jgi:HEAT repeat protein